VFSESRDEPRARELNEKGHALLKECMAR
jgi:hypothetical protein